MASETVKKLRKEKWLTAAEFKELFSGDFDFELIREADCVRRENYGTDVFVRGLIEFSNYCKNNCYYCGIRCGNRDAVRYRLSKDEILDCAERGYKLGFRTFVLQGGARTRSLTMIASVTLYGALKRVFRTVLSLFPLGNGQKKVIRGYLLPVQTDIFSDTRLQTGSTTESFIRG